LGRVIKLGSLDQVRLMDAIAGAETITVGKARWTITNVIDQRNSGLPFIFAKLAKFSQEGHVTVVDTSTKSEVDAIATNLLIASTPFVYLPDYSGIAYMHLWNGVENDVFIRRFKEIIEATYNHFFVNCSVEPVENCIIEHAKGDFYSNSPRDGIIWINDASPTITGCTISNSSALIGIRVESGTPTISNSTISGMTDKGIYVASGSPTITGNTVAGNSSYGLYFSGSPPLTATNNNWGDPSGPLDDSDDRATGGLYNPNGKGNKVSNNVIYYPWTGQTSTRQPLLPAFLQRQATPRSTSSGI